LSRNTNTNDNTNNAQNIAEQVAPVFVPQPIKVVKPVEPKPEHENKCNKYHQYYKRAEESGLQKRHFGGRRHNFLRPTFGANAQLSENENANVNANENVNENINESLNLADVLLNDFFGEEDFVGQDFDQCYSSYGY